MIPLGHVAARYRAAIEVAETPIAIARVEDPQGADLNKVLRRWRVRFGDVGDGSLADVMGGATALQWNRIVDPIAGSERTKSLANAVLELLDGLEAAVVESSIIEALRVAIAGVADTAPPIGIELKRFLAEVGDIPSAIVCTRRRDVDRIAHWAGSRVTVVSGSFSIEAVESPQIAYALGPPSFFAAPVLTAPVAGEIIFLSPAWIKHYDVPQSPFSAVAEFPILFEHRLTGGRASATDELPQDLDFENSDLILPAPVWNEPATDEGANSPRAAAQKVLLSGNSAIWLDDGERIRTLDPEQPKGERVVYVRPEQLQLGNYLLLRPGVSDRAALRNLAFDQLGSRSAEVLQSQQQWKDALENRIADSGRAGVVSALDAMGVVAANQAVSWASEEVVAPRRRRDFELLLSWLELDLEDAMRNARAIQSAVMSVGHAARSELEDKISGSDLKRLVSDGHLEVEAVAVGISGMVAAEVLAISSRTWPIGKHNLRQLFADNGGRWLD